MWINLYTRRGLLELCKKKKKKNPSQDSTRKDMIYAQWFSGRLIAPSCEPPSPEILENIFFVTNCEKITVSDCCLETHSESRAKRGFLWPAEALVSSYLWPGLWIYVAQVMQLWFCSHAKGHTGGFLHNAWLSPSAYLLITAITTATLVCLFTGMAH